MGQELSQRIDDLEKLDESRLMAICHSKNNTMTCPKAKRIDQGILSLGIHFETTFRKIQKERFWNLRCRRNIVKWDSQTLNP